MTSCLEFRSLFHAGTNDPALLDHLRSCDPCLDYAAHLDPDVMFRAIGGEELVPPGGVDAFVEDVMRAVHVRSKEDVVESHHPLSWTRRLAVAATVAASVIGATLVYEHERQPLPLRGAEVAAVMPHPAVVQAKLETKPVVETYSSANATIVEVPSESAGDTKIVMVIDDKLPADL
ncbi:MAG TPA: hypothetical protein VH087_16385 [Thermoanaerobaculia bacterium]|nr:hypothetical protein [Thermoanaerobaculia bacterium]